MRVEVVGLTEPPGGLSGLLKAEDVAEALAGAGLLPEDVGRHGEGMRLLEIVRSLCQAGRGPALPARRP